MFPLERRRGDITEAPVSDHSNTRIIHPRGDGGIIVSTPVNGVSPDEIIPAGEPYLVLDAADVPTDTTFREAWVADFQGAPVSGGRRDEDAAIERARERTRAAFRASLRGPGDGA